MQTKRLDLVIAGMLLLGMAAGCQERNPAYITPRQDAAFGPEATPDLPGAPDVAPDVGLGPEVRVDAPLGLETGPDLSPPQLDVTVDVTVDQGAADARDVAADARDTRRPDDAIDVGRSDDGRRDTLDLAPPGDAGDVPVILTDGPPDTGASEAAPADVAPLCPEGSKRDCAAPGNPLIGACHAGQQKCAGGAWGTCEGEVLPAAEVCDNGVDDDCDGMSDEGCVADCVVVAPGGDDQTADGTAAQPFATVAAGLAFAAAVDGGGPRRVCVAAGADCAEAKTYVMDTALEIPSGARLQGNYALDGTTLKYCVDTQPPITALQFTTAAGAVVFGAAVTAATEVGGFVIERYSSSAGVVDEPVTGVSVRGGQRITLSGIFITDAPLGQTTYGVDVEGGGGQVTITRSSIGGGNGALSAVGVFVGGGSVVLRDNCDAAANGICRTGCAADEVLGIRGRVAAGGDTAAASSAVHVTANASASTIIANTLCGGATGAAADVSAVGAAGLRCEEGNCATVSGNFIEGASGRFSVGVVLSGGGGVLAGNAIQPACASEAALGVVLEGSVARLENNRVLASACAANSAKLFRGLQMLLGARAGGPDVHSNVIDPGGRPGECQSTGVNVSREVDAVSAGVLRNNIVSAGTCGQRIAIVEQEKAMVQLVENNDLYAPPMTGQNVPVVLYRRGGEDATTAEQVNKLEGAASNISADPKFVSYPDDLHLTTASPCLDKGTAAGAPAIDGDGRARPQRAGFDIGAYEVPAP